MFYTRKVVAIFLVVVLFGGFVGCAGMSKCTKGALAGGVAGGTAGALIGKKSTKYGLIGAAIGALGGAYIGCNEQRKDELRDENLRTQESFYQTQEENRRREQELRTQINDLSVQNQEREISAQEREKERFVLSFNAEIIFAKGSSRITTSALNKIQHAVRQIKQYPDLVVNVTAYADPVGSYESNLALSINRAENVKIALVRLGINARQIVALGMGELTSATRHLSRKAEITVEMPRSY